MVDRSLVFNDIMMFGYKEYMMKKPELLAPAGTKQAFINAINAGANAIFMAGHRFGARAFAENFTEDDLKEAINYAHLRGVLVFIVVNTLTFDDEVEDLLSYTDTLVKHHIDALIVQDIGMIKLLANRYPHVSIHASTQINAHHVSQVKFLKSLGVKRVILARETSLETIKEIKRQVDIELEVFIHGALCVSYSGNCLISSIINDRSGNRGECAYNCRLPYQLVEDQKVISESSYLMSAKDLMTIKYIDQLIEAGIDSFKIEGRMRKKEYVAQAVSSYRKAIDHYFDQKPISLEEDIDHLKRVFNRDYTKGYILNEIPKDLNNAFRPNHLGVKIGEVVGYETNYALVKLTESLENGDGFRIIGDVDYGNIVTFMKRKNGEVAKIAYAHETIFLKVKEKVSIGSGLYKTLDSELEKELYTYQSEDYKVVPLKGYVKAFSGKPLTFELFDLNHHHIKVTSINPLEMAKTKPLSEEQLAEQFAKLGGTPFYMASLEVLTDHKSFISVGEINQLRRDAIKKLSELSIYRDEPRINPYTLTSIASHDARDALVVKVHTLDQLEAALQSGIEMIYYDDLLEKDIAGYKDIHLIPARKRIIEEDPYPITKETVINELGALYENKDGYALITDEFINVTNIYTAALLSQYHVKRISLSSELDKKHILNFSDQYHQQFGHYPNLEMVVYGHKDLMISKYCPVAKTFGYKPNCKLCFKHQYYLKHDYQGQFALINDGHCNMRVMDPLPLNLIDELDQLKKAHIHTMRLDFTLESKTETVSIIKAFQQAMLHEPYTLRIGKYRKGHLENRPTK